MWYRRYGYKHVKLNGAENFWILLAFPIALTLTMLLYAQFENSWLFWLFIPFAILLMHLIDKWSNAIGKKIRHKKQQKYISKALECFEAGDRKEARKNVRMAKIYGRLPDRLLSIEKQINSDAEKNRI